MKIALLQMSPVSGKPERNLEKIARAAQSAAAFGADLLVTPELGLTGYALGAAFQTLAESANGPMLSALADIAKSTGLAIAAGFPERDGDAVFNSAVFMEANGSRRIYRKSHLFGEAEKTAFAVSDQLPVVFSFVGFNIGMLICYDIEFPEMVRGLALDGADLVVIPTALPAGAEAKRISERMVPVRAQENHVFIAYADLCGAEGDMAYEGGSVIVGPDGEALARAGAQESLLIVELDKAALVASSLENPYLTERRPDIYSKGLTSSRTSRSTGFS